MTQSYLFEGKPVTARQAERYLQRLHEWQFLGPQALQAAGPMLLCEEFQSGHGPQILENAQRTQANMLKGDSFVAEMVAALDRSLGKR